MDYNTLLQILDSTLRLATPLLLACLAMSAVVVLMRAWIGDWTALHGWQHRVGWLLVAIAAGAAAYGVTLLAAGLRPRHLRH